MDAATNQLVECLHSTYDSATLSNVTEATASCMVLVQHMSGFSGEEKKAVVVAAVTKFVDDTDLSGVMEPVVLQLIPVVIDQLVAADHNQLRLRPRPQWCTGCLPRRG